MLSWLCRWVAAVALANIYISELCILQVLLLWSQKIKREVAENKATFMVTDVQGRAESRGTACDGWEECEELQG